MGDPGCGTVARASVSGTSKGGILRGQSQTLGRVSQASGELGLELGLHRDAVGTAGTQRAEGGLGSEKGAAVVCWE